ncbi:enolase C-terminal domain-like protein [Streptomyces sp. NPDC005393]|uniref:enolase C-terminal domain-like protein n=1 Tax=Streptomyces sp. NPDC005393 TaxID=3157041 RepID=UPI0033A21A2C
MTPTARPSDVRVEHAEVRYRAVPFRTPLVLSSGPITGLTEAQVTLGVRNRKGARASGHGTVLLSHPWAYGGTPCQGEDRDAVMRTVVELARDAVLAADGYHDPLRLGVGLARALGDLPGHARTARRLPHPIPRLAGLLCLAPVDTALHDAWARAAGASAYRLYDADHLGADLADYLGPAFAGRHPADCLAGKPATRLPVQHVVGVDEPLTPAESGGPDRPATADGPPRDLATWVRRDGVRWLKLKVHGTAPDHDAARVREVYRVATEALAARGGGPARPRLSLDPNEAYGGPEELLTVLRLLERDAPEVRRALVYAEQPFPRDASHHPGALATLGAELPIVADEGADDATRLDELAAEGWSGVAVKTAKGQTQTLLAACWARRHGRFLTLQDLTSVGAALEHSAAFAAHLSRSVPALECNSRQYAPDGNAELAAHRPALLRVRDGELYVPDIGRNGIR